MRIKTLARTCAVALALSSLALSAGCSSRMPRGRAAARPPGSPADAKALSDACYKESGVRPEVAVQMCSTALELDPTLAEAQKNMAIALCDQGRCGEALPYAQEAVRLKPDFDKAHYVLGKTLFGVGRYTDAAAEQRAALRLKPDYAKALYGLGIALDRLGDAAGAADSYARAVALSPDDREWAVLLELARGHAPDPRRPAPPRPAPSADFVADTRALFVFGMRVRDLLFHEEFAELERLAGEARSSKELLPSGDWKLAAVYAALSAPGRGRQTTDADWQYLTDRLRKWADSDPRSAAARIALAEAHTGWAWHARGHRTIDKVSDDGMRLFRERLSAARRILEDARAAGLTCPHWYDAMLNVALGQGAAPDEHERIFAEAVASEPSYLGYYVARAVYLMPRWHGRPGDWTRFAADAARRDPALYYRVVSRVAETHLAELRRGNFLAEEGVSWQLVRSSFADSQRRGGASAHDLNLACLLAVRSGDRESARDLFARVGKNRDEDVWPEQEEFDKYRSWASAGG